MRIIETHYGTTSHDRVFQDRISPNGEVQGQAAVDRAIEERARTTEAAQGAIERNIAGVSEDVHGGTESTGWLTMSPEQERLVVLTTEIRYNGVE